jgi:hypothetical protein
MAAQRLSGGGFSLDTYAHVGQGMQADVSEEIERLLKWRK